MHNPIGTIDKGGNVQKNSLTVHMFPMSNEPKKFVQISKKHELDVKWSQISYKAS